MHFLFIPSLLYTEDNNHNQNTMHKCKHSRFSLASASDRRVKAKTASKTILFTLKLTSQCIRKNKDSG